MHSESSQSTSNSSTKLHFRLRTVTQNFNGTAALDKFSLSVRRGEAVALVGPSGAGKTTLLRLLNGMIRPTSGEVEVDGARVSTLSTREIRRIRARVGFIHQDLSLVPNLRVSQNVIAGKLGQMSFFSSLRAMFYPPSDDLEKAHELLKRVGIPEKLFERTDTLSGGQQQRVAIARALFQEPEAILADEPVSSIDPARARDTVSLLTEISKERKLTLVMSIHNLDLATEFFPRLIGMRGGKLIFDHPATQRDDNCFKKLYELSDDEMMKDGA